MKNDARLHDLPAASERFRRIESEPLPPNLGGLVDQLAEEVPDRQAWHFFESGERITFGQLRQEVNRIANGLATIGVSPGTHVGVMLPNVPALPLTWLALARIGAVMVPVNVRYTAHVLEYVLDDSQATFLVVDAEFLPAVASLRLRPGFDSGIVLHGGDVAGLRSFEAIRSGQDAIYRGPTPETDDLLNIQYTSGTTGLPKGCMLTHRYLSLIHI